MLKFILIGYFHQGHKKFKNSIKLKDVIRI